MMPRTGQNRSSAPPLLRVSLAATAYGEKKVLEFDKPFRIGRGDDCEVCIKDDYVSRTHAEAKFENGRWLVRDVHSGNGMFVDGSRVESVPVSKPITIRLGIYGPMVGLEVEEPEAEAAPPPAVRPMGDQTMVARYVDRYFAKSPEPKVMGEHTMMVRRAFEQVQAKQRWNYGKVMAILVACILVVLGYAFYLHQQVQRQKAMAESLFYTMKSLDLNIANLVKLILDSNAQQGREELRQYQSRRQDLEKNYDQFLSTLHVYAAKMSEQDKLILRVARIFGECELAMPSGFVPEVESYIKKWQSSGRLARDIRIAKENGYTGAIAQELLAQNLPPQFFYLALQESDFNPYNSGPPTRKGIAKGMWQFIPETAVQYGLRIGPLADLRRPDPGDDRHHWEKETKAAAKYLKDLYRTDAQASGLLVMASYNWGENQVIPLIRSLPANPKDRNFWKLLSAYRDKLPDETYKYVFYIVSAAVIGENPRLFGFDFENPLAQLEVK
jgi:soluble lytic murein transglycosylase-like protein